MGSPERHETEQLEKNAMNRDRHDIVIQIRLDRTTVRRALTFAVVAIVVAVPSYLVASAVSWPSGYPFQAGTPISAAEVNAAFAALETAIEASALSESDLEGFITNGGIDLHPATTVGGAGIVTDGLLGQDCEPGKVVTGVGADGALTCAVPSGYSGADFAVSGQACPEGQVMTGIAADGAITCGESPAAKLFVSDAHLTPTTSGVTYVSTDPNSPTLLGSLTVNLIAGRTYLLGLMGEAPGFEQSVYAVGNHYCLFDYYSAEERIARSVLGESRFPFDVPVLWVAQTDGTQTLSVVVRCSLPNALYGAYRFYIREM